MRFEYVTVADSLNFLLCITNCPKEQLSSQIYFELLLHDYNLHRKITEQKECNFNMVTVTYVAKLKYSCK